MSSLDGVLTCYATFGFAFEKSELLGFTFLDRCKDKNILERGGLFVRDHGGSEKQDFRYGVECGISVVRFAVDLSCVGCILCIEVCGLHVFVG